jgi:hypothetical protein
MKKIDGEIFWMIFTLFTVLIILYMAWDFRASVENASNSLNYSECLKIVYDRNYDIHGSFIINNTNISGINTTH